MKVASEATFLVSVLSYTLLLAARKLKLKLKLQVYLDLSKHPASQVFRPTPPELSKRIASAGKNQASGIRPTTTASTTPNPLQGRKAGDICFKLASLSKCILAKTVVGTVAIIFSSYAVDERIDFPCCRCFFDQ